VIPDTVTPLLKLEDRVPSPAAPPELGVRVMTFVPPVAAVTRVLDVWLVITVAKLLAVAISVLPKAKVVPEAVPPLPTATVDTVMRLLPVGV